MTVDKHNLFTKRLPEREIELPSLGTVRVRGLSRKEALSVREADTADPGAMERRMLAFGMVDPSLTEDEAGQWQDASLPDEIEPVTVAIAELSGMAKGAEKQAMREFRNERGATG